MSDEFLSQEEIDALLGGETEEKEEVEEKPSVAPFDFSEVEHIKKGGLPGFELIFERWIKVFREEVRKILPRINMVTKENIYITRFQNFMLKIPLPSSYTIFSMRPLKESALLVVDSRLVFTVISVLFGGPAKPFKVEGREFTKLEMRVVEDFINAALKTYEQVWDAFYPVMVEVRSIELNPSLARIVSPNEKVIIVECKMDIDGYEAPFYFCFPQSMFLPIKDIVYSQVAFAEDPVWKKSIEEKIRKTNVRLGFELVKMKLKIKDILEWEEGTELMLYVSPDQEFRLFVEDKHKFYAKLGKLNDKYAAMITRPVFEEEE
ncbi:MAG: flagellar motor switch protein FliM [Aquificae bacterium]|nr:flagellar motor switch protein FliM [Aquificota bacterium]